MSNNGESWSAAAPPRPRAAIFDWDNTLVDSWPVIVDSVNTTLVAMGHTPWDSEEARQRIARSLRDSFPEIFGEKWEEARDIFYARFAEIHLDALTFLPGAEALIRNLVSQGVVLSVVSNKAGDHLRTEARHMGLEADFHRFVGAADAEHDKPSAAPVHLALADSGVAAGPDVWFVGDSVVDIECAHNADCTPIYIGKEPFFPTFDTNFTLDWHFSACTELAELVRHL